MKGLLRFVLVAVFCHVITYGQQCAAPLINFVDLGFYATQTFEGRESQKIYNEEFADIAKTISVETIRKQQEVEFAVSDDLREYLQLAQPDIDPSVTTYRSPDQWFTTCPYWWYPIPRYEYYYYSPYRVIKGVPTYKFCWSYTRLYVAKCYWEQCRVSNNVLEYYGLLYRCLPEYRSIKTLFLCLEVTTNEDGSINHSWNKRWQRLQIPYGCGCSSYFGDVIQAYRCVAPKYVTKTF